MKTQLTGHWKKRFDYRFLSAEELIKDAKVTIKSIVTEEAFNGKTKEDVMAIYFEGKEKSIICNRTNAKRIAKLAGSPNVEDWIGLEVTLTTETVSAFGQMMAAIRIKPEGLGL